MGEDTRNEAQRPTTDEQDVASDRNEAQVKFAHPGTVLVDEPVDLTITNVSVDSVDIRVSLTDFRDREWVSRATDETPDDRLDLGSATAVDGKRTSGVTELVQQATPEETSSSYEAGGDSEELRISVEHDGTPLGSTTIERRFRHRGVTAETVDRGSVVGKIYEPEDTPAPAVVVLHGSDGVPKDRIAQLLASHGFAALAMQYFDWQGRNGLPAEIVEVPLESVANAVEWLQERPSVCGSDVGLFGRSKGGELALLAGSRLESVGPVVSVNGSGVVWAGVPQQTLEPGSSWTADGAPVSFIPYADAHSVWETEPPREFEPFYERSFETASEEAIDEATIAVESIAGPVLLVSGGADRMWDSVKLQGIAADRLEDHDRDHEHLVYPEAGHAITTPFLPTANRERTAQYVMGGSRDGYAAADSDHWQRVLETFETLRE